jgi:Cof subfamily protein (haloacid dehalogenase superfamily)
MAESLESIRLSPGPFASIQLIVADLDGSFIDSNSRVVSERLRELVVSVTHFNTAFTIATGRTLNWVRGIPQLTTLLKWHHSSRHAMPIVLYNGSVVVGGEGRMLRVDRIDSEPLSAILSLARDFSLRALCYSGPGEETLFSDSAERVFGFGKPHDRRYEVNGLEIEWMDGFSADAIRPVAVLLPLEGVPADVAEQLEVKIEGIARVSATRSSLSYIEIRPEGSSKAAGLSVLAEHLSVNRQDILALGDNDNDVEMLRWAGVGVAVQGASDAALAASDFVCPGGAVEGANQVLAVIRSARRATRGLPWEAPSVSKDD